MFKSIIILGFAFLTTFYCNAQLVNYASAQDSIYYANTKYRLVGPFRGGRASGIVGSMQNKNVFYMGATGGGVWRTRDAGATWDNISDKYFGGTIGAIALAPTDENIIYVGEGENTMRGNVSEGIQGMWKSVNGGRTWQNIGLQFGRHITRIVVHPKNENIVWACVMGSLFGGSTDRGVYKTTDGGKNWKKILGSNNANTGAIEMTMEPNNPDVLYASLWQMKRTPYSMESGGEGSGIYKSNDGGETWKNISKNNGLPKDSILGISYVAIAPSNPDRLYALIEAKSGGLYMSNDGGETWTLQTADANIRQRAWYFSKMAVDPKNQDKLFICNVEFWKSTDAGKSLKRVNTPHGDHHNIWIDEQDGNRMILADDGGAQISMDGGDTWSSYYNQPTAQFYRISADNAYPYHLLAGQQDNSSVRILSKTDHGAIYNNDFVSTAGGEAGVDVADPLNPDIVYGGEYAGILRRLDHKTGEVRHINVWPESNIGSGAENLKYRFQWNYPLFFSTHNPKRLYAAGNCLFYTEDEGITWKKISDDLTTNNKKYQAASGGPITKDNTTVEYFCTIFAAAESPLDKDVLYTGSDDGVLHITQDGGKSWKNITPFGCPSLMMWNCIEPDPFDKATCYAVGTRYKSNDFSPYIYKTTNFGLTWTLVTKGIPKMHFARCIRADKKRKDLLYAGTEYGMYISYDGGANWRIFQLNLPRVPITDMCIKYNDLCIATQGRAFWILDDLSLVQQYNAKNTEQAVKLFDINETVKFDGYLNDAKSAGKNPPVGVVINYWLKELPDTAKVKIIILDTKNTVIKTFEKGGAEKNKLEVQQGMNQFVWDMYYPCQEPMKDMILWNGNISSGPQAVPGTYKVRFIIQQDSVEKPFTILPNPTYKISNADYQAQFDFLMAVKAEFDSVQNTIKKIRDVRSQMKAYTALQGDKCPKEIKQLCDSIYKQFTAIEEKLYQTKAKSGQDVLNYPIQLNDKIAALYNQGSDGYSAATMQSKEVLQELKQKADAEIKAFHTMMQRDVNILNTMIKKNELPVIGVNE
jgi:photosystem II stability/assembly factor-like uncharacterized protein